MVIRFSSFALLTMAVFFAVPLAAQGPVPQPSRQSAPPQVVHDEDGGVRTTMESIVIPPKPNAPFTLTLATEWVQSFADGGSITLVNQRHIARDSKGRFYQERWVLVPKNGKVESKMNVIQIADPNAHTLYNCFFDGTHLCRLLSYTATATTVIDTGGPPPGPLPNDTGWAIHEDLGKQLIFGVETAGSRDSVIYNPGVFGNDRKLAVEREYWFCPKLGINLISRRSDPRAGTQHFTVTELDTSEPDEKLFELPQGFNVVDDRKTTPPQRD